MSIEIVAVEDSKHRYWLRVDLEENGDLVLEGQDLSPGIEELFGRDEYEYWYTVKAANVPTLLASLNASSTNATNLDAIAELLRDRFVRTHGISTSTAFKAWCKDHDIPYDFANY